jgi:hypothetical protein
MEKSNLNLKCEHSIRAWNYLNTLLKAQNISYSEYFDDKGFKCYHKCCYNDLINYQRGGEIYEMPIEGVRFGLKFKSTKGIDVFQSWINGYHATSYKNLASILKYGFKKPGEKAGDKTIDFVPGHIEEDRCRKIYDFSIKT